MKNAAKKRKSASTQPQLERLRVLLAASLPLSAASFESGLRAQSDLELIVSSGTWEHLQHAVREADPDVLILDLEDYEAGNGHGFDWLSRVSALVPTIVLAPDLSATWIFQALQAGARGILPHATSGGKLAAAVKAVASGLVVLNPEFAEAVFPRPSYAEPDELELPPEPLTEREQEVLAIMAEGLLNKEIADRLHISEHTVKFHISSIMAKLGASSRTEAVTRGIRRGIVFI